MQFGLIILLLCVSLYDLRTCRVPNLVTYPLFFGALVLQTVHGEATSALLGGTICFIWMVLPYMLGWVGAGDVKLLTAIGVCVGWPLALSLALYSGLLGGPLVLFLILRRTDMKPLWLSLAGGLGALFREIFRIVRSRKGTRVPYALSIFLGYSALCLFGKVGGWS